MLFIITNNNINGTGPKMRGATDRRNREEKRRTEPAMPWKSSLLMYKYCGVSCVLPTAQTICIKNHKRTNHERDCASFRSTVGLLSAKWFVCLHCTPVLYFSTCSYAYRDCDGFSFIGVFIFVFIKLPVCKSPTQNHDLFYDVQIVGGFCAPRLLRVSSRLCRSFDIILLHQSLMLDSICSDLILCTLDYRSRVTSLFNVARKEFMCTLQRPSLKSSFFKNSFPSISCTQIPIASSALSSLPVCSIH